MKPSYYVNIAMYAGEIMLRNGAEAQRVEDTINRILQKYGFENPQTITTTTGMYISVVNEDEDVTTLIRRIHTRTINLNKIAEVNSISRKIVEDKITPEKAMESLEEIFYSVTYPDFVLILAWAFACFGFSYVLESSLIDALATFIVGLITGTCAIKFLERKLSRIAYTAVTSALIAMLSIIISVNIPVVNMDNVIIGGIMPLVPGVASVNAIRDVLNGDYICAQSRILDVILVAICIALGVGFSLSTCLFLGGVF